MKNVFPNYYESFRCIAGDCRHSCCVGWEIDIDGETLEKYRNTGGEFGRRLRENISVTDDGACFILSENERCPFLNRHGLCDVFTELGEENLCQICSDHPRFRNFYSDRIEIGLGLCCEAACELILGSADKFSLDGDFQSDNPSEAGFFKLRRSIFDILTDRTLPIRERTDRVLEGFGVPLPDYSPSEWARIYSRLERLDPAWDGMLALLENYGGKNEDIGNFDTVFEQLAIYFIYRHLAGALEDSLFPERIAFAVLSVRIIGMIFCALRKERGKAEFHDIVETARMYSSEIEYSDENIRTLLEILMK